MVKTLIQSSLTRNTFYLTLASIVQKIFSFGYYFYLADRLGPDNLGKYTFVLTFTGIFIIFMDFGLGPVLTREGAKTRENLNSYFNNILSTKIILTVLSLATMVLTINLFNLLNYKNVTDYDILLVYLGGVVIILDTFTFTFFSVFRALKQLKYEALGVIIYQTLIVGTGLAALFLGLPLEYVIAALIVGSTFNFIYSASLIHRRTDLKFRFLINRKILSNLIKISAPFAIAGIFYKLNGSIDSVMLKLLAGDRYVGWYALAFKLTFALTVLPGSFATSYFPEVSYHFKNNLAKVRSLFENGSFYMFLLSLPISIGTVLIAKELIFTVWSPAFEASIKALQILMFGLFFIFFNYPIGNLLNACNRQTTNTINMGIALIINVILNFILIPRYTYLGASISALTSSLVLVLLGLPWVYKITHFNVKFLLKKLFLIMLASGLMAAVIYFLRPALPLLGLIPVAGLAYLGSLFLVRAISLTELRQLIKRKV